MAGKFLGPYPDPLITNTSLATSFNGTPTNIENKDNVGVQLSWAGANPTGAVNIQVSLDYNPRFSNIGTWTLIEDFGAPIVITLNGVPGTGYFDLNQLNAQWLRVTYTTVGGAVGTLTSTIAAKEV